MAEAGFSEGFFDITPDMPSGFTPYLNGSLNDANPFEAQYNASNLSKNVLNANTTASSWPPLESSSEGSFNPRSYSLESSNSGTSESPAQDDGRTKQATSRSRRTKESSGQEFEDDVKRTRFLARNRLAASKCRTKKKEWTNNLEAAARQASQQSRELQAIVQRLRDEVLEYKTQLMNHSNCDCAQIKQYMQMEKSRNYNVAPY